MQAVSRKRKRSISADPMDPRVLYLSGFQTTYRCITYRHSPSPYIDYYSSGSSLSPASPSVVMDIVRTADQNGGLSSIYSIRDELCYYIKSGDLENIKTMFALHSRDKIEGCWKMNNLEFVSPIHDAAESGQMQVLQWLLSPSIGFDINEWTAVCFHGSFHRSLSVPLYGGL